MLLGARAGRPRGRGEDFVSCVACNFIIIIAAWIVCSHRSRDTYDRAMNQATYLFVFLNAGLIGADFSYKDFPTL
jgi:hypothetical protein